MESNKIKVEEISTKDGFRTFMIQNKNIKSTLGSKYNYENNIKIFKEEISQYDENTVIIVFGHDTGEHIKAIRKSLSIHNKLVIIEPIEEIYKMYKYDDNVLLITLEEFNLLLSNGLIDINNLDNFKFLAFGNYKNLFQDEYKELLISLKNAVVKVRIDVNTIKTLKYEATVNLLNNLRNINDSYSLKKYKGINKNIPAIIVSAGPSLDKNIKDLINNKNKLDKFFVIAGNRTVKPLIDNGIKPDLICTIDPLEPVFEMMKEYRTEGIPLAYIEGANSKLINDYTGTKIFASTGHLIIGASKYIDIKDIYFKNIGGSVAHFATDVAVVMGCNPIVFIGQDLAYTNEKHHSDSTKVNTDIKQNSLIEIEDVFGKKVKTTYVLEEFKKSFEKYIKVNNEIVFINSSMGAKINGADFEELDKVINKYYSKSKNKNKITNQEDTLKFDIDKLISDNLTFINQYVEKVNKAIDKCKNNISSNSIKKIKTNLEFVKEINDEFIMFEPFKIFTYYINDFLTSTDKFFGFNVNEKSSPIEYSKKVSKGYISYYKELLVILNELSEILKGFNQ